MVFAWPATASSFDAFGGHTIHRCYHRPQRQTAAALLLNTTIRTLIGSTSSRDIIVLGVCTDIVECVIYVRTR